MGYVVILLLKDGEHIPWTIYTVAAFVVVSLADYARRMFERR
jgi:hypothetical protein